MNRRHSFHRLWESLQQASYFGDRIDVNVWVDRNRTLHEDVDFVEQIKGLHWRHGVKSVHVWRRNAGIRAQWIDTWYHSCGSVEQQLRERAVILEDDLTVSPHFYRWLKAAHIAYSDDPRVASFTLTRASLCPAKCADLAGGPGGDEAATHFLSPLVGSWGLAPKASHWVEFRSWYHEAVATGKKPYVDGVITTEWYKLFETQGRENSMWSAYHVKYVSDSANPKPYILYVKAPNGTTLASNYKEKGLHYKETASEPDHPLLIQWHDSMETFPTNPTTIDWHGRVVGGGN
jgi:hypothetical protein